MNKEMSKCVSALTRPAKKDVSTVYNFDFIVDDEKRKTAIINYLENKFIKDSAVSTYINELKANHKKYMSLIYKYQESIRSLKNIDIDESILLFMGERDFFNSYGLAMSKCISCDVNKKEAEWTAERAKKEKEFRELHPDKEPRIKAPNYGKDELRVLGYAKTSFATGGKVSENSLASAMLPPFKMHKNGKYKTQKKYANACYLKANKIKRKFKAFKEKDTVFNNNKYAIVDDFKSIIVS